VNTNPQVLPVNNAKNRWKTVCSKVLPVLLLLAGCRPLAQANEETKADDEEMKSVLAMEAIEETEANNAPWTNDEDMMVIAAMDAIHNITDKATLRDLAMNDKNPYMRIEAAWKLDDQALYAEIAKNQKEEYMVRYYIIQRLKDQNLIAEIAINDTDWEVREAATMNLNDKTLIAEILKNKDEEIAVRMEALRKLDDQAIYEEYARYPQENMRALAAGRLQNKNLRVEIATNDESGLVRWSTVWGLTDQEVLFEILQNSKDRGVRIEAVRGLNNITTLAEIVRTEEDFEVRKLAVENFLKFATMQQFVEHLNIDGGFRKNIVPGLNDLALLEQMKGDAIEEVRKAAEERLKALRGE